VAADDGLVESLPGDDDPSLRTRAAKGVFWTATGAWGRQIALFVVIAIQARLLAPTDFGLVAFAAIFVGLTVVYLALQIKASTRATHSQTYHLATSALAEMASIVGMVSRRRLTMYCSMVVASP